MPKMKTNRAAAKRFHRTGSGLLVRSCAKRRHILTKKSRTHKRNMRMGGFVSDSDESRVLRMLPNG